MSKRFSIKRLLPIMMGFFILIWIGDTLIDALFFLEEHPFLSVLFSAEPRELYMRTVSSTLLTLLFMVLEVAGNRNRTVERALKHSDELTSIFFDSTKHAICIIDMEGLTIAEANRNFLQKTGARGSDVFGKSFPELLAILGVPEEPLLQVRECAAKAQPLTSEIFYCRRNGEKVYREISSFPIGNAEDGIKRVLHVMRDITARKTAEALLQESESRYRAIFENTGTAMAIIRPDGTLHMVNREFEAVTGFSRGELEGKRLWSDFVGSTDVETLQAQYAQQCQPSAGFQKCVELQLRDKDGSNRTMAGTWAPIQGSDQVILSLADITTQKQVQEALRENRATLAVAQRMAHLGNWEWDLTTDTVTWSEEMYRIFDVVPEGFTPTHDWVLQTVHPEDRERVTKAVNDAIYNHKVYDIEYRIVVGGGAVRTLSARGEVTYDASGMPLRMVGTNLDVSWRSEAEQALRSSEEKFSKAFRASPDSIVITRAEDGAYIDVNQAFEEITGYARDEVIGKTSTSLGLWADPEARMVMLRLLNQYGHVRNLDVRFRVKSGELRELLWSAEVIEYCGEACLIAISRDVTEQRHLEKELLESDARLYMKHEELKNLFTQMEGIRREWEETMDCLSDMFILADQSGKIRRFNRAVEVFSGKAHRDIVGSDSVQFLEEQGLKDHVATPGAPLFHERAGRWLVLKRYTLPGVASDGSSREVIIINDTTALESAPVVSAPRAASQQQSAH